jgi:hypothetical protein
VVVERSVAGRRRGSGPNRCPPDGRCEGILEEGCITSITTREPRRGNGPTPRGWSTSSSGKDKDNTSSSKVVTAPESFNNHTIFSIAGNQRFLYPQFQPGPYPGTSVVVEDDDDGLGSLPPGWEKRVQPEGDARNI